MTSRSHLKPRSLVRSSKLAIAVTSALAMVCAWHTLPLQAQGVATTLEGTLDVVWGDPDPDLGSGGEIRYMLTLADGSVLPLQLTGREGTAAALFGKRVIVSGRVLANQVQPANALTAGVAVDALTASDVVQTAPLAAVWHEAGHLSAGEVLGRCRSAASAVVLHRHDESGHAARRGAVSVNAQRLLQEDVIQPVLLDGRRRRRRRPRRAGRVAHASQPEELLCPVRRGLQLRQTALLSDDATALGRAQGINFKVYNNINFVLSNDLDCCAWGGGYYSSVDGKSYGATWEPPWGQNVPTYAHEMGHSIGLPHSGWVYYAYDSPWDVMSSVSSINLMNCGSYASANGFGHTRTLSAPSLPTATSPRTKTFWGGSRRENQVVTDTSSNVTVSLEGRNAAARRRRSNDQDLHHGVRLVPAHRPTTTPSRPG